MLGPKRPSYIAEAIERGMGKREAVVYRWARMQRDEDGNPWGPTDLARLLSRVTGLQMWRGTVAQRARLYGVVFLRRRRHNAYRSWGGPYEN